MTGHPPPSPPPPGQGGPQPYPYPGQQPPPPSRRGGCGKAALIGLAVIGALVVLVVIVSIIAVGTADDEDDDRANDTGVRTESGNTESPPQEDVVIDSCEAAPGLNFATAKGTIRNHSSETSTYFIEVNITDEAGTIVGNAVSSVANVPAGGTATFEAPSTVEMAPGVTCRLAEVNRVAS
jgi:hypothetical protein